MKNILALIATLLLLLALQGCSTAPNVNGTSQGMSSSPATGYTYYTPYQGVNITHCGHAAVVSGIYIRVGAKVPVSTIWSQVPRRLSIKDIPGLLPHGGAIFKRVERLESGDILLMNYILYKHYITVLENNNGVVLYHDPLTGATATEDEKTLKQSIMAIVR